MTDHAPGRDTTSVASSPFTALNLLVAMLGEPGIAAPGAPFYDRLAEAVCRLGPMRRAVVFISDDVRLRVWAAGSHNVDATLLSDEPLQAIPLALRALERDEVIDITSGLDRELPPHQVARFALTDITCIPMSAGGRHYGVVLAERGPAAPSLTDPERDALLALGKLCALAACARAATRQQERARQLADRLDLARDVHERVVQRLFGVSLALGGAGELTTDQRDRCAEELQVATEELRDAIQRPMTRAAREVDTTLREELERLGREHTDLELAVYWDEGTEIPAALEPLAQTVVGEAVRNARKHARPTRIDVRIAHDAGALTIAIVNDGVGAGAPAGAGVGLRLAAFEALNFGAAVDFGRTPPDRWHVRLVLPLTCAA
ncbi:MAG TPA: GAF domain-containing protein [Baekduia sp.]|jgi:signal transduction histidine kinase